MPSASSVLAGAEDAVADGDDAASFTEDDVQWPRQRSGSLGSFGEYNRRTRSLLDINQAAMMAIMKDEGRLARGMFMPSHGPRLACEPPAHRRMFTLARHREEAISAGADIALDWAARVIQREYRYYKVRKHFKAIVDDSKLRKALTPIGAMRP